MEMECSGALVSKRCSEIEEAGRATHACRVPLAKSATKVRLSRYAKSFGPVLTALARKVCAINPTSVADEVSDGDMQPI